jgi:hypothetical protein
MQPVHIVAISLFFLRFTPAGECPPCRACEENFVGNGSVTYLWLLKANKKPQDTFRCHAANMHKSRLVVTPNGF